MLADKGKCLHLPEPIVATRDYQGSIPVKMHLMGRSGEKKEAYFSTTDTLLLTRADLPLVNAHYKRMHLLRTDAPPFALNSTDFLKTQRHASSKDKMIVFTPCLTQVCFTMDD